jgi:XapX domain-containing protein
MDIDFSLFAGVPLGLGIVGFCRYFDLPLPAPPQMVGSFLVVAMTLGFLCGSFGVDFN